MASVKPGHFNSAQGVYLNCWASLDLNSQLKLVFDEVDAVMQGSSPVEDSLKLQRACLERIVQVKKEQEVVPFGPNTCAESSQAGASSCNDSDSSSSPSFLLSSASSISTQLSMPSWQITTCSSETVTICSTALPLHATSGFSAVQQMLVGDPDAESKEEQRMREVIASTFAKELQYLHEHGAPEPNMEQQRQLMADILIWSEVSQADYDMETASFVVLGPNRYDDAFQRIGVFFWQAKAEAGMA